MPDFHRQVQRSFDLWKANATNPYVEAYNTAFENYKETAGDEDERVQAQIAFFFTIASVLSTSVVMAVMVQASVQRGIVRAGLRTLGRENTRLVVDLIRRGRANPSVSFAVGSLWDSARGALGDRALEVVTQLVTNSAAGVSAVNPLNRAVQLESQLLHYKVAVGDLFEAVTANRGLSGAQQRQFVGLLEASPFMNPPGRPLNVDRLTPKIELGFYMQKVLDGDYLMTRYAPHMRIPGQRGGGINALPSERNYPRSGSWAPGREVYTTVEVDRPGFTFQQKINELHRQLFNNQPFYPQHGVVRYLNGTGNVEEIRKAEDVMNRLSRSTRPPAVGVAVA